MKMLDAIRKMSLRTRLALLAAFALISLLLTLLVAWRLARATETFALRQADSSLRAAARDLARSLYAHPYGYRTIEEAAASPERPNPPREKERLARHVPPHLKTLFATYADPLARLTAITLHRYPDASGGFYRSADDSITGQASPASAGTVDGGAISPDAAATIRELAREAGETGAAAARTIQAGSDRIIIIAYPTRAYDADVYEVSTTADTASSGSITAAWTMQRLSNLTGVSDKANLAALLVLILSIVAVGGLALVTVRDLRSGVSGIEQGLSGMRSDLGLKIEPPSTPELAHISGAINQLAESLRVNLARQSELERDLRRSERLSALGRLVAGVAHEVRNPLAAIKLKVQLARRNGNAPEKLDHTFCVINEEIDRLDGLVRRLLEFGWTQPLEESELDLAELTRRRASLFDDVALRAGVRLELALPEGVVPVRGDTARLAQVLDNLIRNALEAMPDGGRLNISCESVINEEGRALARLAVEDTGRGILPEDEEHIFEPFFTGRETGTGLGLAIAREVVEAHGGRISLVRREAPGTLFQVELPRLVQPGDERQNGQRPGFESREEE